jgi:hypothetical protein
MTREIRADYQQLLMLVGSPEDWLGPEHPARIIRDLVDSRDLSSRGFQVRATEVGRTLRPEGKMPQLNGRDHLVPPPRIFNHKNPRFETGSECLLYSGKPSVLGESLNQRAVPVSGSKQ